jgi:hypothetical protein
MWIGFLREESASVGMREWYRVTNTKLNREVAKVLHSRFAACLRSYFAFGKNCGAAIIGNVCDQQAIKTPLGCSSLADGLNSEVYSR